jgi:hypothetical protein
MIENKQIPPGGIAKGWWLERHGFCRLGQERLAAERVLGHVDQAVKVGVGGVASDGRIVGVNQCAARQSAVRRGFVSPFSVFSSTSGRTGGLGSFGIFGAVTF